MIDCQTVAEERFFHFFLSAFDAVSIIGSRLTYMHRRFNQQCILSTFTDVFFSTFI